MFRLCRDLLLLGAGIVIGGLAVAYWCRRQQGKKNATRLVTRNAKGEEVMDIDLRVGGEPEEVKTFALLDDDSEDPTVEDVRRGYDSAASGATTAADGSSSIVSDGLNWTVTPLAASPLDAEGQPVWSEVESDLDPDTTPGSNMRLSVRSRVRVWAVDATIATRLEDRLV